MTPSTMLAWCCTFPGSLLGRMLFLHFSTLLDEKAMGNLGASLLCRKVWYAKTDDLPPTWFDTPR